MPHPSRTLLLSLPFGTIDRPALGISLLKATLQARGLPCDLSYPCARFARRIGPATYRWITDTLPYTAFAGDWCFTLPLYGRRPEADWDYVRHILRGEWRLADADIRRLHAVREATPAFLAECLAAYDWSAYAIVGLTSTFTQNLASLAFAKALKAHAPHLRIVFGGANWEGEMGEALFAAFPFVDHVCQGEADESFPALVEALGAGERTPAIPGVLSRGADRALPARALADLDRAAIPDFADFHAMRSALGESAPPTLLMETSRGCWWGAKHHCTFCGLNGQGMGYRAKSPDRALRELAELTRGQAGSVLSMTDNIVSMRYFEDFFPRLAQQPDGPVIFYETKANLDRRQVELLRAANVCAIQPGIESLSDHLLTRMRKGSSLLRNVQLLKLCRELGVGVEWNILTNVPGETDADYDAMAQVIPLLVHLQPPSGLGPIRIDRFSPYHTDPAAHGISGLRPLPVFTYLYPFAEAQRARMVGYFAATGIAQLASREAVARMCRALEAWKRAATATLMAHDTRERLCLVDRRGGPERRYVLTGLDRMAYLACDRVTSAARVARELTRRSGRPIPEAAVARLLERLAARGLVLQAGRQVVALALFERFPADWIDTPRAPMRTRSPAEAL